MNRSRKPLIPLLLFVWLTSILFFITPNDLTAQAASSGKRNYQPIAKWRSDVIYNIFVDRFFDANPANNISNPSDSLLNFQNGDLQGVIDKLDYLKDLGATAILLNPITPTESYHGYHITDHFTVDPRIGTLADFQSLIKEAHRRNIKVLFDLVTNHVGRSSKLFSEHPEYFRTSREYLAPNEVGYIEAKARASFYNLPDFDQSRPDVYEYLIKFAKFWIDQGIDGFRMDAVIQIEPEFWAKFNRDIKEYAGKDFFILGEIYDDHYQVLNEYVEYFDAFFDFRFYDVLSNVINGYYTPRELYFTLSADKIYKNQNVNFVTFVDNHDVWRFISSAKKSSKFDKSYAVSALQLALIQIFTNRGIPYLFYGTEIALPNAESLEKTTYDASRSLMVFNRNEQHFIYNLAKKLIRIRAEYALYNRKRFEFARHGFADTFSLDSPAAKEIILVASNFGNEKLEDASLSVAFLNNGKVKNTVIDLITGEKIIIDSSVFEIDLEPMSARILKIEKSD